MNLQEKLLAKSKDLPLSTLSWTFASPLLKLNKKVNLTCRTLTFDFDILCPPPPTPLLRTKNDKVVGVTLSSRDKSDPLVENLNFGLELNFCIFKNDDRQWLSLLFVDSILVFHICTEMPILAFSSLLCENKKKSSDKILPPVGIEPRPLIASDSKSNTLLSTLT